MMTIARPVAWPRLRAVRMPVARARQAATTPCAPKKKHCFSFHLPKIHCLPKLVHTCSYEWVLKKKHNFCLPTPTSATRGGCAPVYATGQGGVAPSGQGAAASGQYSQIYGAGQHAFRAARPATSIASAPAEMTPAIVPGEEAPPAPEVGGTTSRGGLLLPTPAGN